MFGIFKDAKAYMKKEEQHLFQKEFTESFAPLIKRVSTYLTQTILMGDLNNFVQEYPFGRVSVKISDGQFHCVSENERYSSSVTVKIADDDSVTVTIKGSLSRFETAFDYLLFNSKQYKELIGQLHEYPDLIELGKIIGIYQAFARIKSFKKQNDEEMVSFYTNRIQSVLPNLESGLRERMEAYKAVRID